MRGQTRRAWLLREADLDYKAEEVIEVLRRPIS